MKTFVALFALVAAAAVSKIWRTWKRHTMDKKVSSVNFSFCSGNKSWWFVFITLISIGCSQLGTCQAHPSSFLEEQELDGWPFGKLQAWGNGQKAKEAIACWNEAIFGSAGMWYVSTCTYRHPSLANRGMYLNWKWFLRYWECLSRPCCWWWGGCSPSVPLASTLDLYLRRMALYIFHHLWELDLDCWSLCLWLHWLFHHCWCSRQDQPWARKWDHYRIKFHPAWGLQCLHPSQWHWTCGAPNPSYLQWYALKSSTLKQHTLSHVFCLQTMFVWLACLPTQWKETPLRMSWPPSPDGASFPTALLEHPLSKSHFQTHDIIRYCNLKRMAVIYSEYTNFSGLTMLKDSVWCPMMIVLLFICLLYTSDAADE